MIVVAGPDNQSPHAELFFERAVHGLEIVVLQRHIESGFQVKPLLWSGCKLVFRQTRYKLIGLHPGHVAQ